MVDKKDIIDFLNIPVYNLSKESLFYLIDYLIKENKKTLIVTLSTEIFMYAKNNKEFADIVRNSIVIADSAGIMIGAKILGNPLKEKLSGIDVFTQMVKENKWKIFMLGAKEGVAEEAKKNLEEQFNINCIVGTHHGYFKEEENEKIIQLINKSKADILAIALGSPKQEEWFFKNKDKLNVKIAMGVGGSFDVLAGKIERAPLFMQKLALEWLWRLLKEPKRIKRMSILPLYLIKIIRYKLTKKF